jgi:hypothetical protein
MTSGANVAPGFHGVIPTGQRSEEEPRDPLAVGDSGFVAAPGRHTLISRGHRGPSTARPPDYEAEAPLYPCRDTLYCCLVLPSPQAKLTATEQPLPET